MVNGNKDLGKKAAIVIAGSITDIALEYITTKFAKQSVSVDKFSVNAADGVGVTAGLVSAGVGMAKHSPEISLFGAGALAASLATIFGKSLMAYNPINASARAALSMPTAPVASPQQTLIVGNFGGGGNNMIHKINTSPAAPCANCQGLIVG
jgi:hypothetical protein